MGLPWTGLRPARAPATPPTLWAAGAHGPGRRLRVGAHRVDRGPGPLEGVGDRSQRETQRGRPTAGLPLVVAQVRGLGGGVEQDLTDVHGLAAVHQDLVALGEDRDTTPLEPLDEVDLPQRPAAVERARGDPRDQLAQLVVVARARQRGAAYVVADLEVRVVDPHGVGEPARHRLQPLAVAGHEGDPVGDQLHEAGVVEARVSGLEDLHRGVVHRRRGGLGGQQGQVPRPQPLGHVSPFVWCRTLLAAHGTARTPTVLLPVRFWQRLPPRAVGVQRRHGVQAPQHRLAGGTPCARRGSPRWPRPCCW